MSAQAAKPIVEEFLDSSSLSIEGKLPDIDVYYER